MLLFLSGALVIVKSYQAHCNEKVFQRQCNLDVGVKNLCLIVVLLSIDPLKQDLKQAENYVAQTHYKQEGYPSDNAYIEPA